MNDGTARSASNTKRIAVTAILMAMNIALSSFGVPVPGGHLYLNDIVICTASLLLDPLSAFAVGGIGAFIGDMLFYPAPMFVSLVVHGLQAVAISLCCRRLRHGKADAPAAIIGVTLGAVIMVVGYTLGRAFVYSTPEYALAKLPFQFLQAGVGAVLSILLCYSWGIQKAFQKLNVY